MAEMMMMMPLLIGGAGGDALSYSQFTTSLLELLLRSIPQQWR
jgi:hypothetical protein